MDGGFIFQRVNWHHAPWCGFHEPDDRQMAVVNAIVIWVITGVEKILIAVSTLTPSDLSSIV